ncbi:ATP-binding protein [Methanoplanus limicola]|uniref:AAA ATPase n=1 Tax=Methanoplanus limicola DSM 2279 TaxID=937775 RepID=H1YY05_9EURY|nr:ATP-binding protein [Methanoplanus limicola]EHQ36940.1 AAA ATPase [Methanoplanus limicola DSM 2279]
MISDRSLEELILDQHEVFVTKDPGVKREIDHLRYMRHNQIVVISGVRRCGKSTLMRQFADHYEEYYYINFDDERLINFKVSDFSRLMVIFKKIMKNVRTIFIDEIQNIEGWERFVRRIHDEGYKIFITGSNARLLSSELGTHLTGRYTKVELYPFSFSEFLDFRGIEPSRITSEKKADIIKCFDYYLENGGFPEFLKYGDTEFLKRSYDDIIYRDIIARHGIREVKSFLLLVQYINTNAAKDAGYASLAKAVGLKSPVSVRDYIGFLEEAYLVFELYRYDASLKRQYSGQKKMYVIDNGMRNTVSFRFSKDTGRLLENMILIELKRRESELFFFREKNECDFIICEGGHVTSAIQVSYELNGDNLKRETEGLRKAMASLDLKSGIILTYNQEEEIADKDGKIIYVMPAWRWLLER